MTEPPIVDRLLGPEHPELGCDECFDNLDTYVEQQRRGDGFALCGVCVSPADCARARHCLGMRAHLAGCPACAEEYASLQALLDADRACAGAPPGDAPA
ncbi:MAG TPA: hypothetical protein VFE12_17185 [Acetobacteraceae bacterium]|nr:hypothetical protein [Acetobacteraceae bacterium]